ncbi:sigma factor-like helix-turn-helix DNA-binding protein [Kitasatospora sp. NPDC056076]|uniref:sigma factor-like helix-turn-helix DNA-binding protein n=1 Tax=Kitasatospora sp. NPDC056076 TaxID=3345703 RepID=UPI0035D5C2F0
MHPDAGHIRTSPGLRTLEPPAGHGSRSGRRPGQGPARRAGEHAPPPGKAAMATGSAPAPCAARPAAPSPEATTSGTSHLHETRRTAAALPPERRNEFVLTTMLGLPYEDAADVIGCPVGTVRSCVYQARSALMRMPADAERQPPVHWAA